MNGMARLCRRGLCCFAISCCTLFTDLLPAWGQPVHGFSQVHFDGTFVILGQHILDTSDLGVLLQETDSNFRDLSNANGKDFSWDSEGVRYTSNSKSLKVMWVLDPSFLHAMNGHPTHVFDGKLSILAIDIVRNKPIPAALLSEYELEPAAGQVLETYLLKKNGWKISIITDRDRKPEAVTLEHSLAPD
jgi:hypothetical protein